VLVGLLAVLVALVPVRRAWACGPDFPPELLADRLKTLAELPDGAFALEAARLLPKPAQAFPVVEAGEPEGAREGGGARETALYAAGAKAFHGGDLDGARARFLEVLALPGEERRRFSCFAAYMLGRMADSPREARQRFGEVRELVRQGFEDPLGLAVGSLGEEARVLLQEGDDTGAIHLYAEQAAHGSGSAVTSLLVVARAIARDEARRERVLREPLGQRLLATYAWTRGEEMVWQDDDEKGPLMGLLNALAAVPGLAGADRLAAGAWRAGRFDLAERFAGQEQTALASWVKAKLALRRGDRTAADQHLAEALTGLAETDDWRSHDWMHAARPRSHLAGERAILALSRGDFVQAAEHTVASCSWFDMARVTESLLTVEELRRLVAAHGADPAGRCAPELEGLWDDERRNGAGDVGARLRLLLARRLLRTGQEQEALTYFRGTPWEEPARRYVESLEQARAAWSDVEQAQALYTAARLARSTGLELLGTEVAPDWALVDGDFQLGGEWERYLPLAGEELRAALKALPLTTDTERQRLAAHAAPHALRFHYRSTAADLAEQAAALMPPRSQAYAALLCHAARFTASSEPERGKRLWSTYVQRGALLLEDRMSFGQECPEPDFERVRQQQLSRPWGAMRLEFLAAVGGGLLLPAMLGTTLLLRRRRGKTVQRPS
jgi:hypothetical protein